MSLMERYQKAMKDKNEAEMNDILHDDFKFTMHSSGNVLSNLDNLGIEVNILSVIGNCENGKKIIDLIAKKNVKSDDIIVSENSRTNYKMRLIADGQHIVRADWNNNKINEKP